MLDVVEISNNSYNGTSSLLMIIILIIFLYFTMTIYGKLNVKLNPDTKYASPDFTNSLIQNTMITIQHVIGLFAKQEVKDKVSEYTDEISNMKNKLNEYSNTAGTISSLVGNANNAIYKNFSKKISGMQTTLDGLITVTGKIKKMMDNNIINLEQKYVAYQKNLQAYVDNLVNMMKTISVHITNATVTPSMYKLITPLKTVFNSIHESLKNNLDFIKDFYPSFDLTAKTPTVDTTIKSDINSSFKTSSSILKTAGYK